MTQKCFEQKMLLLNRNLFKLCIVDIQYIIRKVYKILNKIKEFPLTRIKVATPTVGPVFTLCPGWRGRIGRKHNL